MTEEVTNPDLRSQDERQLDLIRDLNSRVPSNPQGDAADAGLKKILQSLSKNSLSDALRDSFSADKLKEWKEYAEKEFEAMGQINRKRVRNLAGLSDEDMHRTMFEGFFLFDINPLDAPTVEVQARTGEFDDDGKPVMKTFSYEVFQKNALYGIEGVERFVPKSICEGEEGMHAYLKEEYSERLPHFQKAEYKPIKALTTIGSLGGIGHKPDSDMDAQVIINTNPEYRYCWNDADFFLALLCHILERFYDHYFLHKMDPKSRAELRKTATGILLEEFQDGVSPEEAKVVEFIFTSRYRKEKQRLILEHLKSQEAEKQTEAFMPIILGSLKEFPDCEMLIEPLRQFFGFLQKTPADELRSKGFTYSVQQFSQDKLLGWLTQYFRTTFLGVEGARQILWRYAVQNNYSPDKVPEDKQKACFLESISSNNQLNQLLLEFFDFLMEQLSHSSRGKVPEIVQMLQQKFGSNGLEFPEDLNTQLQEKLDAQYREHMVKLIESRSDFEAKGFEADLEFPLHLKIQQAEAYLTQKYPSTEIHFFTNILRKQRAGQHTPYLVSPEGSMAYSNMLNDFLLNPAVMMCGLPPMPFDLPQDFKVISSIGVFPDAEWTLNQSVEIIEAPAKPETDGDSGEGEEAPAEAPPSGADVEKESFVLGHLPNWGEIHIPRKKFLEHAVPIFLRESEKVSHRNLPKALLNCWWLEMIVCIDKEDDLPTSLTRLLWNPDQRYFLSDEINGPLIDAIIKLETDYPGLPLDPWWLKFTEMLARFESYEQEEEHEKDFSLHTLSVTQKQIIFCFAQHLRISDIINYGDNGKAKWLDENETWRSRAMVDYYNVFFSDPEERAEVVRFSQGRDDAGNRVEKVLKQLFLESMKRVESKLCQIGLDNAVANISNHLARISAESLDLENAQKYLHPLLAVVNQRVAIEDKKVLIKVKKKMPMNALEKMQARNIYDDHKKLKSVQGNIVDYFSQFKIKIEEGWVRKAIEDSKVFIAGDALENVIFKYHFDRNFERKPFQVPLPISKSLSIPRNRIKVDFNPKTGKWLFSSMLTKQEAGGGGGDSVLPMFEGPLVDGLTRCVSSGYVGFGGKYLSTFEKPPAQARSEVATNPITGQDLFNLAQEIKSTFASMHASSQEVLENIHYVRDVFMICHVNRYNMISLVVRDNLGEQFVINFDIKSIPVKKVPPKLRIGGDEQFPEFLLRFNSQQCRVLFLRHLAALKIPILSSNRPKLNIWISPGKYDLPIAQKFLQRYINGIARALWPTDSIGTREQLKPTALDKTFDQMGQEALN